MCTLDPRCLKFAGDHHSYLCKKDKNSPAKCANCNLDHPVNYRGCSFNPLNKAPKANPTIIDLKEKNTIIPLAMPQIQAATIQNPDNNSPSYATSLIPKPKKVNSSGPMPQYPQSSIINEMKFFLQPLRDIRNRIEQFKSFGVPDTQIQNFATTLINNFTPQNSIPLLKLILLPNFSFCPYRFHTSTFADRMGDAS